MTEKNIFCADTGCTSAPGLPLSSNTRHGSGGSNRQRISVSADEAVLQAYELVLAAREALSWHGVALPPLAELKAEASRMNTLDEALNVMNGIGRVLGMAIVPQA